jgi:hypothetical protein
MHKTHRDVSYQIGRKPFRDFDRAALEAVRTATETGQAVAVTAYATSAQGAKYVGGAEWERRFEAGAGVAVPVAKVTITATVGQP